MIKLYKIDAVHPVAKRVVKSNLTKDEMLKLYQELQTAGYKNDDIIREECKFIYEDGDMLEIPPEIFDTLPDSVSELEEYTQKDVELVNAKSTMKYIFGDHPKVMKGKVVAERINRSYGNLVINWENSNDGWEKTNVFWLEALGYEFKEPEFSIIPIINATDDILNEEEMVIKHLMMTYDWNEQTASNHLVPVLKAMNKAGVVFYQP